MSSEHARAVRQSNLYEHEGISKSLLERIALLIRKSDEGEEPDPLEGWCDASQDTLAAMHGCSREEVNRQATKFEQDGWLTIRRFRDGRGHKRCHYAMTPKQLESIQARKMEQDEHGEYIRERDVSAVRGTKSRANLPAKGSKAKKPSDERSQSLVTNGHNIRGVYPWVSSVGLHPCRRTPEGAALNPFQKPKTTNPSGHRDQGKRQPRKPAVWPKTGLPFRLTWTAARWRYALLGAGSTMARGKPPQAMGRAGVTAWLAATAASATGSLCARSPTPTNSKRLTPLNIFRKPLGKTRT
jgi:hypothetical protein